MLFGVSDGIQDITRRFGIVRRIRFILEMAEFKFDLNSAASNG